MFKWLPNAAAPLLVLGLVSGCASTSYQEYSEPPTTVDTTPTYRELAELPPPPRPVAVAVYDFPDETGQLKPSDEVTNYSKAVTQGAAAILIKALQDAGRGRWFDVVERNRLTNLLKERKLIQETRQMYGEAGNRLPPLQFAGLLLEGVTNSLVTGNLIRDDRPNPGEPLRTANLRNVRFFGNLTDDAEPDAAAGERGASAP